ncbi:DNA polymerase delta, subunit 4-domain-containing protein [Apodospora peruviana]|uniref:DNA polymerase delta, subunit 4-domain-containing protein n=1 Tax=Apodospora peruviana TaxID=516989 RepID=A0AAE0HX49_9PEZI|nr:DNA polymerase delta, subunit 4-domain-containing protein [Apodospora peruviana]
MPTTRKSTRSSGAATGAKQSILSFNHRVTKSVPKSAKDSLVKPAPGLAKEYVPEEPVEVDEITSPVESEVEEATTPPVVAEKSDAEVKAARVSDAAIERYWGKIETSRMAKEVHRKHTEGLSTGEKVLRYFDVSSHYGPCIGISRIKRWQRAERLGLKPPIEVLAVLIREEEKGNKAIEKAHMDALMNTATVGGVA